MAISPCKDCYDRELGCHSNCERYKQFKADNMVKSQARRDFLRSHNEHVGFLRDQKTRRERAHR